MTLRRFTVADRGDVEHVVAGLARRGRFTREPTRKLRRVFYDTFDWRLFGKDSTLEHEASRDGEGSVAVWRSLRTGEVLGRFDLDTVPRFAADLPVGPAARRLAAVIEMRALLPLVEVRSARSTLRLLDAEDKTVGRITIDDPAVVPVADPVTGATHPAPKRGHPLPTVIEVVPVRGYAREARSLTEVLAAQVVLSPADEDVLITALRSVGRTPGAYSSKLEVALDAAASAADAWLAVLRELFDAMAANEPGLRADVDSEFLHDYRVAVRRTRSILGQARGVLPTAAVERFRDDFAWLGQATNPTRDLDVFLLDLPAFRAGLPADRRDDLDPFEVFLEARQRSAHRALVAELRSRRYRTFTDAWRRFLEHPDTFVPEDADPGSSTPDAATAAPHVAAHRIWRAHRRVIRDGRKITRHSPPERLHDLRKDAKKLRYLLECFGRLLPADEVRPEVKKLKGLQDVLGEYQDCQLQIGSLERFAQDLLDEGAPAPTVMAMGLLVEQLDDRERGARSGFRRRFAAFDHGAALPQIHQLARSAGPTPKETDA